MMTVHEVSRLTGVSIRALRYYDRIGLLRPAEVTEAGYRLYDEGSLEKLQQILLFRELEFPLRDIGEIVNGPGFDREKALEQQIGMLTLKKEHIEKLIRLARERKEKGGKPMSFEAFDTKKMDEYTAQAKASWGNTPEWSDYEQKREGRSMQDEVDLGKQLMEQFKPFGAMAEQGVDPASEEARAQAIVIQEFISEHFYKCSNETFAQLGIAYGAGGEFTENINAIAGPGSAEFAAEAIKHYCS